MMDCPASMDILLQTDTLCRHVFHHPPSPALLCAQEFSGRNSGRCPDKNPNYMLQFIQGLGKPGNTRFQRDAKVTVKRTMVMGENIYGHKGLSRKDSGFTLMELMIASGVVAMSLGVLFGSLISIGISGQVAEGKAQATSYMLSVLEQVRYTPRANLFTFTPPAAPQAPGYTMAVALDALKADGSTVRLPLADAAAGAGLPYPLGVRATVVYTTPRGHMCSISSITYAGT